MEKFKCRICLEDDPNEPITLSDKNDEEGISYAEIYCQTFGFANEFGPQIVCMICKNELLTSFKFKRKAETSEAIWSAEIKLEIEEDGSANIEESFGETNHVFVSSFSSELHLETPALQIDVKSNSSSEFEWPDACQDDFSFSQEPFVEKEVKKVTCPHCFGSYKSRTMLLKHCRLQHADKMFECRDCTKKFRLPYLIRRHRRIHHKVDTDDTPENADMKNAKYHSTEPKKSKPKREHDKFACKHCSEEFVSLYRLTLHRKDAHPKESRPPKANSKEKSICCYCGKIMLFASLDIHLREVHSQKQFEYTCYLCGTKLNTRTGLIAHMKQHLNTKYNCRHCNEEFPNYGSKRNHELRFHEYDRLKYECNYCQKRFMTRSQFSKHHNTHTGERNFTCEVCGFQSTTREGWKRHLATHSDIRPFACSTCSAAFKTKQGLRVHRKCHMEWEYECPVCEQKFLVNQAMRIHVAKNHPDYVLPPPGTVMNKIALKKIAEISEKYNMPVTAPMLSSRKGVDSLCRDFMK